MPDAVLAWRFRRVVGNELGKSVGEVAHDGHWVRPAYACAQTPLLPTCGIAGNWQLHVDGTRLGVSQSQEVQSIAFQTINNKMKGKIMKRIILTALMMMVGLPLTADSVLWHFNGFDGTAAPSSITDTTGTYTLSRGQASVSGQTYDTQLSQSDSKGSIVVWTGGGTTSYATGASGSVQMWRDNSGSGYRAGCAYYINDSIKTILPTNSAGEIESFTLETEFKAAPYDEATCQKRNMSMLTLGRGNNYGGGTAVIQVNAVSTGGLFVQANSRVSGNGDLCNWLAVAESDFRDGQWHHIALVYTLDATVSPHQGTVELFFDYVSQGTKTLSSNSTGEKSLSYGLWNADVTAKDMTVAGYLTIGHVATASSPQLSIDEVRVTDAELSVDELFRVVSEDSEGFFFPFGDSGNLGLNIGSDSVGMAYDMSETALIPSILLSGGDVNRLCNVCAVFSGNGMFKVRNGVQTLPLNPFTLEFSFSSESTSAQTLCAHGSAWSMTLESGTLKWNHGETVEVVASDLSNGEWHSVALAYVPGESAVYTVFVDRVACPLSDVAPLPGMIASDLVFGAGFSGRMLGLRCTPSALVARDILSVGLRPFVAWWPFTTADDNGTSVTNVAAVDGNPQHTLVATLSNVTDEYRPSVTDDVPAKVLWDASSGKVLNPDNRTALYFRNNGSYSGSGWVNGDGGGYLASASACNSFGSSYTIEMFIKPAHTYSDKVTGLLGVGMDDESLLHMAAYHSARYNTYLKIKGSAQVQVGYASSSDDLAPGEWHHVAVTVDAGATPGSMTVTSYVDYTPGKSFTTNATFDISAAYNLSIGVAGGNRVFEGLIDEVRVSSGALSSDAFMRSLAVRSDLTGVWLVDGLSGVEHYDGGATSYLTGTLAGGVSLSGELPIRSMRFKVAGKRSIKPSASVSFDGTGVISIPCGAVAGADDFTFEATVCGTGTVAAKRRYGGNSWKFGIGSDGIPFMKFDIGDASMAYSTAASVFAEGGSQVDVTAWHHVAMVCDRLSSKVATLYVDGIAVATADISGMVLDDGAVVLGGDFVGKMVGARFSASALDASRFMPAERQHGYIISIR